MTTLCFIYVIHTVHMTMYSPAWMWIVEVNNMIITQLYNRVNESKKYQPASPFSHRQHKPSCVRLI